jgi:membrane protease YdiL (CAAX protease family)
VSTADVSAEAVSAVLPDARRGWRMLACFLIAEVTFVVASVVAVLPAVLTSPHPGPGLRLPGSVLVTALVVPTVAAGLVALIGAALLGQGSLRERLRSQLSVRWRASDVGIGLVVGLLGLAITVPASLLWARLVGEGEANSAVGEVFHDLRLPLGWAFMLFLAVWLIAPACEELVYRGALWRAMEYWQWHRWVIFGLTTVLFSLAHPLFAWSHTELLRTPLLVVISLPLALARLLTGNLLASVVAHQLNNLLPAIGLFLLTQGAVPF